MPILVRDLDGNFFELPNQQEIDPAFVANQVANISIPHVNSMILSGHVFSSLISVPLAASEVATISMVTGSKKVIFRFVAQVVSETQIEFVKDGTPADFVAVPYFNKDFGSNATTEAALEAGGTITDGEVKAIATYGAGNKVGGNFGNELYVFEANHRYSFRVTSAVNGNLATIDALWWELD